MLGLGITKGSVSGIEGVSSIAPPAVVTTTTPLTTVGSVTATLEGSYTGTGVTAVGFLFGDSESNLNPVNGTDTSGSISAEVEGLTGATTYYYKAYATNPAGTSYGSLNQFKTDTAVTILANLHESYADDLVYEFDFTSDNGTYDFESSYYSFTFSDISRVSSITDENGVTRSDVMKIQVSQPGNLGIHYAWSPTAELDSVFTTSEGYDYYYSYAVEMWVFIPSTNSSINDPGEFYYSGGQRSFTSTSTLTSSIIAYEASDVGSWKRLVWGSNTDFTEDFGLRTRDSGNTSTYFGFGIGDIDQATPGDIVYVSDIKVYRRETTSN